MDPKEISVLTDSSKDLPSPIFSLTDPSVTAAADILIAGGGIVGLVTALAMEKYLHIKPEIYEQSHGFDPDVGAGMSLYANGLRVLRDIDPNLLKRIQECGCPYRLRHFERHDGTSVAVANEAVLGSSTNNDNGDDPDGAESLQTIGIRRWKLQQALHEAVQKAMIPIYFSKKVRSVDTLENGMTEVLFTDGSRRQTKLLIGADGGRSAVRTSLLEKQMVDDETKKSSRTGGKQNNNAVKMMPTLDYSGVTCIMGVAENTTTRPGISFPVSNTTNCHGVFYPTGETEQCFRFYFPVAARDTGHQDSCWGNLSQQVSREECNKLANILEADGWDEAKFLQPLRSVSKAVRVGLCRLTPALKKWSYPNSQGQARTILVGDAAHPPVPYIGQGSQQGMEDGATIALLLQRYCLDFEGRLNLKNINHAVEIYESIRIPRVDEVLGNAQLWGDTQQKRARYPAYNIIKEELIQRDVFFHETTPILFSGIQYDYKKELEKTHKEPLMGAIAEA